MGSDRKRISCCPLASSLVDTEPNQLWGERLQSFEVRAVDQGLITGDGRR